MPGRGLHARAGARAPRPGVKALVAQCSARARRGARAPCSLRLSVWCHPYPHTFPNPNLSQTSNPFDAGQGIARAGARAPRPGLKGLVARRSARARALLLCACVLGAALTPTFSKPYFFSNSKFLIPGRGLRACAGARAPLRLERPLWPGVRHARAGARARAPCCLCLSAWHRPYPHTFPNPNLSQNSNLFMPGRALRARRRARALLLAVVWLVPPLPANLSFPRPQTP